MLLPVLEDWFGSGYVVRVAFIATLSVWPLLVNTWMGVRNMSATYELVGRAFKLNWRSGCTRWPSPRPRPTSSPACG